MKKLILISLLLLGCNQHPEKDKCEDYHDDDWYRAHADTVCFCEQNKNNLTKRVKEICGRGYL